MKKQTNKHGMPKAAVNSQAESNTTQCTRPCENKHSLSTPELNEKNTNTNRKSRGRPPSTSKWPIIQTMEQWIDRLLVKISGIHAKTISTFLTIMQYQILSIVNDINKEWYI